MSRYVDLDERVTAQFYDQECEEWTMQTVSIEDVLDSVCDEYTVLPSAEPQWILCSEKLPEDGTEVFVYLFNRPSPYIAWIEDCRWYTEDFEVESENEPIAWMPLPKPYKEGEQDE